MGVRPGQLLLAEASAIVVAAVAWLALGAPSGPPVTPQQPLPKPAPFNQGVLAARFRPRLLFDSREHWRPLDASAYFAEGRLACYAPARHLPCVTLRSPQQLSNAYAELLVPGGVFGDASTWKSPHPVCLTASVFDCDTNHTSAGHVTALYYHVAQHGGYRYFDYWNLYRYNNFWLTSSLNWLASTPVYDEHENDWEGMFVAVPIDHSNPTMFSFVGYAEHSGVYRYLPGALTCGGMVCGATSPRVDDFVADGSQASYSFPCTLKLDAFPFPRLCWQQVFGLPEQGHDGRAPWGANDDPTALQAFPQSPSWAQWTGNWNSSSIHVNSPGAQPRFKSPWCVPDCPPTTAAALSGATSSVGDPCAGWDGAGVSAVVCDRAQVAAALQHGTLDEPGDIHISGATVHGVAANGISQATGAPLTPGQSISITATRANPGAMLTVSGSSGAQGTTLTVPLAMKGTATLRVMQAPSAAATPAGPPAARPVMGVLTEPNGSTRMASVSATAASGPTAEPAPSHVVARRVRGRVLATFDSAASAFAVGLASTSHGAPLRTLTLRSLGPHHRVTIPDLAAAHFLVISALGANHAVSGAVVVRVAG